MSEQQGEAEEDQETGFVVRKQPSRMAPLSSQSQQQQQQHSTNIKSLMKRTRCLILIIVLVGLCVATAFCVLGVTSLRRERGLRLEQETAGMAASIRTAWNDFKLVGQWVHQACHSYSNATSTTMQYSDLVRCTRQDFRGLYQSATSGANDAMLSFRFISYVPNVTHSMRAVVEQEAADYYHSYYPSTAADASSTAEQQQQQQSWNYTGFRGFLSQESKDSHTNVGPRAESEFYFPMHTMEPVSGNEYFIDFDLFSSAFSGQLLAAVSTQSPIASGPIYLSPLSPPDNFIMLLHPGAAVSERNQTKQLTGVAAVGVGFRDMLHRVASTHTIAHGKALNVHVFDTTYPQFLLYVGGARIQSRDVYVEDYLTDARARTQQVTLLAEQDYAALLSQSQQKQSRHKLLKRSLKMDNFEWTIFVSFSDDDGGDQISTTNNNNSQSQTWERVWIAVGTVMIFATCCCLAFWLRAKLRRETAVNEIRQNSQDEKAALTIQHAESQARLERELNDYLAHEVRNPLAAAISACSFLSSSNEEQRRMVVAAATNTTTTGQQLQNDAVSALAIKNKEDIEVIHSSLQFIDDLLRSMLDMNKAVDRKLQLVESYTDVTNDIFEPIRSMFLSHRLKDFEFSVQSPPQLILWVDRMRLKQVVLNLAGNSRKFTCQGFIRLVARVVEEDGSVEIAVEDSGPGIPVSKRGRVFERFQESLDSLQQGTGMGLSLCKRLVELMGGELELDQSFDSGIPGFPGTRFVIRLLNHKPLDMDAVDLEQAANEQLTSDQSERYHTPTPVGIPHTSSVAYRDASSSMLSVELPKDLSILIVDDDMIIRKMFRRLLARLESSWKFDEAANGETALAMAEQKTYDVIFMDQYMASVEKQMLGTEAVVALRSCGVRSCICGLSANDMKQDFFLSGANGFLRKPFPTKNKDLETCLLELFERGSLLATKTSVRSLRSSGSAAQSRKSLDSNLGGKSTWSLQSGIEICEPSLQSQADGSSRRSLRASGSGITSTLLLPATSDRDQQHPSPVDAESRMTTTTSNKTAGPGTNNNEGLGKNNAAKKSGGDELQCRRSPGNTEKSLEELPKDLFVLTVDDDKTLRKLIGRSLKRVEPTWTVDEASSGEEALEMVDRKSYDLIFMDQYMTNVEKGLLGTETVQALRAKGITSRICGLSANSLRDEFLGSGANGFMRKPLPMRQEELRKFLFHLFDSVDFTGCHESGTNRW